MPSDRFRTGDPVRLLLLILALIPIAGVIAYIDAYGTKLPYGDDWRTTVPVALHAADGQLSADDFLFIDTGHRTVFTNLLTVFVTLSTQWNIEVQRWIGLLVAIAYFGVLGQLMVSSRRSLLFIALIAFSVLIFTLTREYNWLSIRHSHWNFSNLFFLTALLVLTRRPLTLASWIMAAIMAICATFSMANGLLTWFIGLVVLFFTGRHKPFVFFAWCVTGVLTAALYFSGSGIGVTTNEASLPRLSNTLQLIDPLLALRFMVTWLGRSFATSGTTDLMAVTGCMGLLLFIINLLYLAARRQNSLAILIWGAVASFSLGTGILVSVSRLHLGLESATYVQYISASGLFWVALAGLILETAAQRATHRKSIFAVTLLNGTNLVATGVLTIFYMLANIGALQQNAVFWGHGIDGPPDGEFEEEACAWEYLFNRDQSCLTRLRPREFQIDELASHRLALFSDTPGRSILPETYRSGDPVILVADSPWQSIHISDWLVNNVPEEDLRRVVPTHGNREIDSSPRLMRTTFIDRNDAREHLSGEWNENEQIWVIETRQGSDAIHPPQSSTYVSIYTDEIVQPLTLTTTGYRRFSEIPEQPLFTYSDILQLWWWSVEGSVDVARCDQVMVSSLWSASTQPNKNYSVTLVLTDNSGVGASQFDSVPAGVETITWEPNQYYLDTRALDIPCALSTGDYALLIGPYDPLSGESIGQLSYLTTLHIRD